MVVHIHSPKKLEQIRVKHGAVTKVITFFICSKCGVRWSITL